MRNQILHGDALDVLRTLPDGSVQCCITSPLDALHFAAANVKCIALCYVSITKSRARSARLRILEMAQKRIYNDAPLFGEAI